MNDNSLLHNQNAELTKKLSQKYNETHLLSEHAPASAGLVENNLFQKRVDATLAQTAEMRTARLHHEAKSTQKTLKNNVFPPCAATDLHQFTTWDNNVLAILHQQPRVAN